MESISPSSNAPEEPAAVRTNSFAGESTAVTSEAPVTAPVVTEEEQASSVVSEPARSESPEAQATEVYDASSDDDQIPLPTQRKPLALLGLTSEPVLAIDEDELDQREQEPGPKKKKSRGRRLKQDNSDLDLICRWTGCERHINQYKFADPGDARNHEFTEHVASQKVSPTPTEDELSCQINQCKAKFKHMSSLHKHMFSVHGLRKFKCPYCDDARFVDRNHLNRHLQKHFPKRTAEEINQLIVDHEEDMMVRLVGGKVLVVSAAKGSKAGNNSKAGVDESVPGDGSEATVAPKPQPRKRKPKGAAPASTAAPTGRKRSASGGAGSETKKARGKSAKPSSAAGRPTKKQSLAEKGESATENKKPGNGSFKVNPLFFLASVADHMEGKSSS